MKVLGIIAEYNPFHNGHLYQLNKAKEIISPDYTVCILSSNFVQRGEPSIINKWARAKSAILAGIDLVIELPTIYSTSSSEYFGFSSVKILDSLNLVDFLCFGSEDGKLENIQNLSDILSNEDDNFKSLLKKELESGISFPKARGLALQKLNPQISEESIIGSNNILAIEYLKALNKLKSPIKPVTIKRISNSYNSQNLTGAISSATSIRLNINSSKIKDTMPSFSYNILQEEINIGRAPIFIKDYESLILGLLRLQTPEQLQNLPYMAEGLHNRLYKATQNSCSLEEFLEQSQTKRYTKTRINRIITNLLSSITKHDLEYITSLGGPPYARVLGFNKNGEKLLKNATKQSTIPIITNLKQAKNSCNPLIKRVAQTEEASTNIYVLGYKNTSLKKAGADFKTKFLKL